jgi:glucokinase
VKNLVLGIDIGGTNTVFGLVDKSGHIVYKEEISTFGQEPVINLLNRLKEKIDVFLKINSDLDLIGIGVGAPNGNYYTGVIQDPPNMSWGDVNIVSMLTEKFACHVKLTNDANAAALGEKKYGRAKNMNDFVTITLGTGLGSGIFTGGVVLYGHDSTAGELGHLSIDQNGRDCNCGLKGCLEMYVSANGIKQTVLNFQNKYPDDLFLSSLDPNYIDGKLIDMAVDSGTESAKRIYEYTGEKLGFGLAQAASILCPEAYIFSGGFSQAGERLLRPTRIAFEKYLMHNLRGNIEIIQSGLPQGQAGILGAASIIDNF